MVSLFQKIKHGLKKFDNQFNRVQSQLFRLYGFKLYLAIVTTFYLVEFVQISHHFWDWLFNVVTFALVFLLFHHPTQEKTKVLNEEKPVKALAWISEKVTWLNQQMYQWHIFKLFLAYMTASNLSQNFRTGNGFLNFIIGFVIFIFAGILFIPPKVVKKGGR